MYPFQVTFDVSDNIFIKILTILAALFIAGTWFYNQNQRSIFQRVLGGIIGGVASYFVVLMFFGILVSFYITIKDALNPNVQIATIVKYDQFTSTSQDSSRRTIGTRTRSNTYYKPTLEYRDKNGNTKQVKGDVSYSDNNKKPIGSLTKVIVEDHKVRMRETPIKTFTFVMNIIVLAFMIMFYYVFYTFAKTGGFEDAGDFMLLVFSYVVFPIAFFVLIYLFLNIGYDYFILGKRYTSFGGAAICTGLGFFLILCIYGFIKYKIEAAAKKKKKALKKLEKESKKPTDKSINY
ncbi:hypothetical protein [Soonwooa sp.]|uniref:hypothetical protein n=1 Tax=Soonwooa sp. TaxID=1938592 RepID=UPI0026304451|nr:hypothetical protein [Soonwooa sp.]